jgi:hypothetical protein
MRNCKCFGNNSACELFTTNYSLTTTSFLPNFLNKTISVAKDTIQTNLITLLTELTGCILTMR